MTRSRKKHPIIKDGGYLKRTYNKMFRRKVAQCIQSREYIDLPDIREVVNGYDICDWKYDPRRYDWYSKEEYEKEIEKNKRK